jgi:hypothetical protein
MTISLPFLSRSSCELGRCVQPLLRVALTVQGGGNGTTMITGHITVIGDGGLLGELLITEFARHGRVVMLEEDEALVSSFDPAPDMFVLWGEAVDIGEKRELLRSRIAAEADPVLVFISQINPIIYFARLRGMHVDRRKLGLSELFDEVAGRLQAGTTTTAPVRAGSV